MWTTKKFKTLAAQKAWIAANEGRFQIEVLFVNNGFAVQYRKMRQAY